MKKGKFDLYEFTAEETKPNTKQFKPLVLFGIFSNFSDIYRLISNKMASVNNIRNGLIDKILSIKNKDFLVALDKLISSSSSGSEIIELSKEQKAMLEMSEKDIKTGKMISQEAMDQRNLEWLNAM